MKCGTPGSRRIPSPSLTQCSLPTNTCLEPPLPEPGVPAWPPFCSHSVAVALGLATGPGGQSL